MREEGGDLRIHVNLVWIEMKILFGILYCALCCTRCEVHVILAVHGSGFGSSCFL
jgi:hypothetical protein